MCIRDRPIRRDRHRPRRRTPFPQSRPDPPNHGPARRRRPRTRPHRRPHPRRSPPAHRQPARRAPAADQRRHGLPLTLRVPTHRATHPAPPDQARDVRRPGPTHRPAIQPDRDERHRNGQLHRAPPRPRRPPRPPLLRRRDRADPPSRPRHTPSGEQPRRPSSRRRIRRRQSHRRRIIRPSRRHRSDHRICLLYTSRCV